MDYKVKLEEAKRLYQTANADQKYVLESLFHELRESEDEKIRKWIKKELENKYVECGIVNNVLADKAFAWLEKQCKQEKQCEQKLVVPFKAKDWYVSKVDGKIHNIKYGLKKQGEQKGYTFKSIPRLLDMIEPSDKAKAYCQKLIDTLVKEGYNTDAKIVEEVLKGWNGEDVPMAVMDEQKPVFEIKTPEESLGIDSATYNKIVDECIYGEQKPTDKIEPFDEYEGLTDFERTLADICIGWIGEEIGWKQYIKDNADVLLKIAVEKFNSVQDIPFEQKPTDEEMKELLRTEYEKGRVDAIAEMQKPVDCTDCTNSKGCINCEDGNMKETLVQEPAWSEEDESNLDSAIYHIRREPYRAKDVEPIVDWLKSLKDRVQPKHEWSKEDETTINNLVWAISNDCIRPQDREDYCDWLKSLKDRYTWKPNNEQLEALKNAIHLKPFENPYDSLLWGLYEQLRKLK